MEAHALLASLPAKPGNLVGIFNYEGEGMVLLHGQEAGLSASFPFVNVAIIYVTTAYYVLVANCFSFARMPSPISTKSKSSSTINQMFTTDSLIL